MYKGVTMDKKDIKVLLDRRKDIQEELNKLNAEYTAIGNLLEEMIRKEEKDKEREK